MTHITLLKPKKQHGSLLSFIFILYPCCWAPLWFLCFHLSSFFGSLPAAQSPPAAGTLGSRRAAWWLVTPWGCGCREGKVTGHGGTSCSAFAVQGGYPLLQQQALSPRFLTFLPLFPPDFGRPSHTKHETGVARKMTAAQLPLLHTCLLWGLIIFALLWTSLAHRRWLVKEACF